MASLTRRERGRTLAFDPGASRVRHVADDKWRVQGNAPEPYTVHLRMGSCNCTDSRMHSEPNHRCKHWWAVWYTAIIPVDYRVRVLDHRGPDGEARYCVAMLRAGVLMEKFGCYLEAEEAIRAAGLPIAEVA